MWPKDEQSNTPSPGSRADVVLTTYEMVNFDKSALGKIEWSAVVVDEAHKLKNCEGKLFNELSLFKKQKTLLLTGTPLQNNVGELWSLLKFVDPQRFSEREKFEKVFADKNKKSILKSRIMKKVVSEKSMGSTSIYNN